MKAKRLQTHGYTANIPRESILNRMTKKKLDQPRLSNQSLIAVFTNAVIGHLRSRAADRKAPFAAAEMTAVKLGLLRETFCT
jgi:hypothetical protein